MYSERYCQSLSVSIYLFFVWEGMGTKDTIRPLTLLAMLMSYRQIQLVLGINFNYSKNSQYEIYWTYNYF